MSAKTAAPAMPVPVLKGLPLLGSLLPISARPIQFVTEVVPLAGEVMCVRVGPRTLYIISHPDGVQRVLRDNNRNYVKARTAYPLYAVSGPALVNMEGDTWLERRRVMQPHFHRKHVISLVDLMWSAIQEQTPLLDGYAQSGEVVDMIALFRVLTAHVFTKTFYGISLPLDEIQSLSKAMYELLSYIWPRHNVFDFIPEWMPFPGKKRFLANRAYFHERCQRLIEQRRQSPPGNDLLSMMIAMSAEDEDRLTDEQMLQETVSLFQGGFDTSSGTLGWVFWALFNHPQAMTALQQEIDALAPDFSAEKVQAFQVTHNTIQETMRLYPSAPGVLRVAVEDDIVHGYRIPAKATVFTSFHAVQRHPDFWDRPNEFLPERFAAEHPVRHPFAYVPFATGPRQCIGDQFALYEMRLTIIALLHRYRFTLAPGYALKISQSATYFPKTLPVRIERR